MDWKQVLSLSPEDLPPNEKDQFCTDLAWFDFETEELDQKKYVALLKLSQELLKYKSQQVEILLSELDTLAAQKGEEEAKKLSSDDLRSPKSKKSASSPDYDDVEIKYREVKSKLKQQIKVNDKQKRDNEKLQRNVQILEQEKRHLQDELISFAKGKDESSSEGSESIIEKEKNVITLQQKNEQISRLLRDIEAVEHENMIFRDQISTLRNELSDAVEQLTSLSQEYKGVKLEVQNYLDKISELQSENEGLRSQIQELVQEKELKNQEIEEYTKAIDARVEKWKTIVTEKDKEIQKLKLNKIETSATNDPVTNYDTTYINSLTNLLNEREHQVVELKSQLENATVEMQKNTKLLETLHKERKSNEQKLAESRNLIRDLKRQIKTSHERCQSLQENLHFSETLVEKKTKNFNEITKKLKQEGFEDLANLLREDEHLESQLLVTKKELAEHVRICNKLQETLNTLENENSALREKCGISDHEDINVRGVLLRKRKENNQLRKLHNKVKSFDNEKLHFDLEIQRLNRLVSKLSNQILDLGARPVIKIEDTSISLHTEKEDVNTDSAYQSVIEENEALRKGLHEVLSNIQTINASSSREIKSDTLEKLLKALDERHIAGWYHPAMRLQAELHELQGINIELRTQLKAAKTDLNLRDGKDVIDSTIQKIMPENYSEIPQDKIDAFSNLAQEMQKTLKANQDKETEIQQLQQLLTEWKDKFDISEKQINILYNQYITEKAQIENELQKALETKKITEDQIVEIEAKLNELSNTDDEHTKNERLVNTCAQLVVLNRKEIYLENENKVLTENVKELKNDLNEAEIAVRAKINLITTENNKLHKKIIKLENSTNDSISKELHVNLKNNLDNMTLKYRELLSKSKQIKEDFTDEIATLNETIKTLENQKTELKDNLFNSLVNKHELAASSTENKEDLAKLLAQSEINELAEKQRANHMSNLYEVVKEQLQKSEERFGELEKYNKQILHKNLFLQEGFVKLENMQIDSVDAKIYQELQENYMKSLQEIEKLAIENGNLQEKLMNFNVNNDKFSYVSQLNDSEILSLKHQILDLQAESDEKALIARLSSDVVYARTASADSKSKYQQLMRELKTIEEQFDECKRLLDQEKLNNDSITLIYQQRISVLENIIQHQRQRYLGSLPLTVEEVFVACLQQTLADKHQAFNYLQKSQRYEHETRLLRDELKLKLQISNEVGESNDYYWTSDKNAIYLKEFKTHRDMEFKDIQLQHTMERLYEQEQVILKMQEDLLYCSQEHDPLTVSPFDEKVLSKIDDPTTAETTPTILKQQETQTSLELLENLFEQQQVGTMVKEMQTRLVEKESKINENEEITQALKSKIMELEMNLSLFRTQIGDRQSQINFYEKHIMELQSKLNSVDNETINQSDRTNDEDIPKLKEIISKLNQTIIEKDQSIIEYQTLIKQCKDEHSLAASRMQEEMKQLQEESLIMKEQLNRNQKSEVIQEEPGKSLMDFYIEQVHTLEKHANELHTANTTLNAQLKASRQECVRWRTLAADRLEGMEVLRQELQTQHQEELEHYKSDSQKWREEVLNLKNMVTKYKCDLMEVEPNLKKIVKEKDDKIHELLLTLRNLESTAKKRNERANSTLSTKVKEFESNRANLIKENETLKKHIEQVLNREKSAREELQTTREQLLKKSSAVKVDKTEKESYQKKLASAEKELEQLKEQLKLQSSLEHAYKSKVTEDFEKWKKYKFYQQTAEKLKQKLGEKKVEIEKLNATLNSYKSVTERLEREKHALESRLKNMKTSSMVSQMDRLNSVYEENERLLSEVASLTSQLEIQKHHSGSLGASMLQEKLESQERKLASMELASKGSGTIRDEIERLQETNANLQKTNLRMEAENLELKLDVKKYEQEVPHLREQIAHLESYIEALKTEQNNHIVSACGDQGQIHGNAKKVSELEKTVLALKRVVEKLQVENKRLQGGSRPCTTRTVSSEKLRLDFIHLKHRYGESIQKIARLEEQLKAVNRAKVLENKDISDENTALVEELSQVKAELGQKTEFLNKVKALLQRAASKEKALQEEVNILKQLIPRESYASGSLH